MFFHQTDQYNHKGKCRTFPRAQDGPLSAHLAVEPNFGHDEQEGHNRVLPYPPPSIPPLSYSPHVLPCPSLPLPFPFLPLCHIFGELSKDADLSGKCQLLGGICRLSGIHARHPRHWYGDEYGMSSYDQILLKVEAIAAPRRRLVTHKLVSNRLYVNY